LRIGAADYSGSYGVVSNTFIDDYRIYNRALSSNEIRVLGIYNDKKSCSSCVDGTFYSHLCISFEQMVVIFVPQSGSFVTHSALKRYVSYHVYVPRQ
jgi:hypothetical protein